MIDTTVRSANLLREVARRYTRAQRVVADCCSTTSTQCLLMTELGRAGAVPLSELGMRLALEKSWVSRAVDGLVERGLVTKEPNPHDARSWLVTLTRAGETRVRDLNRSLDRHAERLLSTLSERERAGVERSLLQLLSVLREDTDIAACCTPSTTKGSGSCR